ncbi:MAG: hypothetical protein J6N72_11170 [Psychrobacter sp.]|nr:hypothetical protein [Psychrobacter sp.]
MNDLAKKTIDALRKSDDKFLNYVLVPMPTNTVFDKLAARVYVPDDYALEMDSSFKIIRERKLAKKQTELVLNTISKITGNSIASKSHAYIKPSIMTDKGFGFGGSEVLASIDVTALPSIDEAANYYSNYDFKSLLQDAIDKWSAIRKHEIDIPFIDWSRRTIGFYLWLLIRCDKSQKTLMSDEAGQDAMMTGDKLQGTLISDEELTCLLGEELRQAI